MRPSPSATIREEHSTNDRSTAAGVRGQPSPPDLDRLVPLHWDHERLLAEIGRLVERLNGACAYLSGPGGNAALGLAQIGRLRANFRDAIARLRVNRREICRILVETESRGWGRPAGGMQGAISPPRSETRDLPSDPTSGFGRSAPARGRTTIPDAITTRRTRPRQTGRAGPLDGP